VSKDAEPPMRVFAGDEFNEMLRDAPPPTDDDVSITLDGRRLDSTRRRLSSPSSPSSMPSGMRSLPRAIRRSLAV
jgi:hypothetical protein